MLLSKWVREVPATLLIYFLLFPKWFPSVREVVLWIFSSSVHAYVLAAEANSSQRKTRLEALKENAMLWACIDEYFMPCKDGNATRKINFEDLHE